MEIPKQSPSTSGRHNIGWWSCATYAGHLPAWPHRASRLLLRVHGKHNKECAEYEGHERPRSPTRKRSSSHKDRRVHLRSSRQMLPRNHAKQNSVLCIPYSFLVNPVTIIQSVSGSLLNSFLSKPSLNERSCLIIFVRWICCNVVVLTLYSH